MSTGPRTTASPQPLPAELPVLDLTGRTFHDYRVLRKLGQGGMGQVYLAEQISLGRKVALKILRPEMASSAQAVARFEAEAKNVARATHANIVQVYAYGVADGTPYIALEYVEGRNLKEFVAKKGPPDLLLALGIMRQVAAALQRAAELGVIHRDIKPENILLTRKGEVKVADFGLSRCLEPERAAPSLTQTGVTMGTPMYMSPEQVQGLAVDSRTDIYSFGITCYHMLTGAPPFRGETAFDVAIAQVQRLPAPLASLRPDLPEALCALIHKMMAKAPDDRPQTGRELLRELGKIREAAAQSPPAAAPLVDPATLASVTPSEEISAAATVSAMSAVAPANERVAWLAVAVVLTLVAAVTGGAAYAWLERRGGPPMGGKHVAPADAGVTGAPPSAARQEQALRDAAEQYLGNPKGKGDLAGGFVVMDLGLLYLENDRLADAEALFNRLASFAEPKSYRMLGQLGQAIVLGLRDKHNESNALLRHLFVPANMPGPGVKEIKGRKWLNPAHKKAVEAQIEPIRSVLDKPRWQYWLNRARWYNQQNGLPAERVPPYLTFVYPLSERKK